jgi:NDP-hexose 4-ketoreductase
VTIPRNVLLFGAAGFLGRHVRAALETRGARVVGVSRREDGVNRVVELSDAFALRELLLEVHPNVIVNCAGRTAGSLSELTRDNTLSVANLLEVIRAERSETRLVQFGSAAEYGPVQPDTPVTEDTPARPEGAYGITKLAATLLVQREAEAGRLEATVLRIFNPVGGGMPEAGLPGRAARAMQAAMREGSPSITLGSLEAYRDFVDARDVAEVAARVALEPNGASQALLNVASGRATQARALIQALAEVAGFKGEILEHTTGSPRSGSVSWQAASIERTQAALNWTPRFNLRSSVADLWASLEA